MLHNPKHHFIHITSNPAYNLVSLLYVNWQNLEPHQLFWEQSSHLVISQL